MDVINNNEIIKICTIVSYYIKTYCKNELSQIKTTWCELEKGDDMTYFQSYDWNEMINRTLPEDNDHYETKYVVVQHDDKPCLIAPLFIIKSRYKIIHKPEIHIADSSGWTDYRNFIYEEFDIKAAEMLFEYLKNYVPNTPMYISCIKKDTHLYNYIENKMQIIREIGGICVATRLPKTEVEYEHILSKSVRQNIRTANNRMLKDAINYTITYDDKEVSRDRCVEIRNARAKKKAEKVGLIKSIKRLIKKTLLSIPFEHYIPLQDDANSKVMTIKDGNTIMAFFNYGYDSVHKEIVVMAAGVSQQYEKYSPGMVLMYEFIKDQTKVGQIIKVDFTRGTERYKYYLGGKEHYISSLLIKL